MINRQQYLILQTNKQEDTSVVWRREWGLPYESPWGILEKFRFANEATVNDVFEMFGTKSIQEKKSKNWSKRDRDMIHLEGFNEKSFESILGISIIRENQENISKIVRFLKHSRKKMNFYFREDLNYCAECIKKGYHSIFHQSKLFDLCPFHNLKLKKGCPDCSKGFTYELNEKNTKTPFSCECGFSFFKNTDFIRIFAERSHIQFKNPEAFTWYHLSPEQSCLVENINFDEDIAQASLGKLIDQILTITTPEKRSNQSMNLMIKSSTRIRRIKVIEGSKTKDDFDGLLYYSLRATYKSIARYIRKILLKNHRLCIWRLRMNWHNFRIGDPKICPFAYAYLMWRKNIEGLDHYRQVDSGPIRKKAYNNRFDLVSTPDQTYISSLFQHWSLSSEKVSLDEKTSTDWILKRVLGHLVLEHFKNWLQLSKIVLQENNVFPETIPREVEKLSTFFILFPRSTNDPIEFHWWREWNVITDLSTRLKCPFPSRKKNQSYSEDHFINRLLEV